MAIRSFNDKAVQAFFVEGKVTKGLGWIHVAKVVLRKLDMVNYAHILEDLRMPPNNRLEALKGQLRGFHSIRVNDQWRIVFRWTDKGPEDVQVMDYHK